MGEVRVKRVHLPAEECDGLRVLVDRLWPRGVSRERAALDLWCREVAPSTGLRRWFHQGADRWDEFERRDRAELEANPALDELVSVAERESLVTLLHAARDTERNHAAVVAAVVVERLSGPGAPRGR